MESPGVFSDSPMEPEEAAYPCKGCGEILEEGKAFELAGSRWHIDCFRCNTCDTLLDSDAILLLLGDGSLICNNCTYSCNACGNKIEDLAILTGEQAFCASCFRCRNCKHKIDNLKYARTSQGIFCMTCHETLMARRRKKSRTTAATTTTTTSSSAKTAGSAQSPMLLDKSLPSLPSSVLPQAVLSPDVPTPASDAFDTPTELSPRPRLASDRKDSSKSRKRDRSPLQGDEAKKSESSRQIQAEVDRADTLVLPSTTYSNNRHSLVAPADQKTGAAVTVEERPGSFDIPLVLDTGILPTTLPAQRNMSLGEGDSDREVPRVRKGSHDHTRDQQGGSIRPPLRLPNHTHSSSPKIGYEGTNGSVESTKGDGSAARRPQTGRNASSELADGRRVGERTRDDSESDSRSTSKAASGRASLDDTRVQHARPATPSRDASTSSIQGDRFQLQEVPKSRKSGSVSKGSKSEGPSPVDAKGTTAGLSRSLSGSIGPAIPNPLPDRVDSMRPTDHAPKTLRPGWSGDSPRSSSDSKKPDPASANALPTATSPTTGGQLPRRKDSLRNIVSTKHSVPRKEVPGQRGRSSSASPRPNDNPSRTFSGTSTTVVEANPNGPPNGSGSNYGDEPSPKASDSPTSSSNEVPVPQPRAQARKVPSKAAAAAAAAAASEPFTTPRAPPQIPQARARSPNHSISTLQTESSRGGGGGDDETREQHSPGGLPQYSQGGEFNMEEDMARILGGNDDGSAAILRRVSSAVRHGRSFSDMETRSRASAGGGKWPPRSPMNSGNAHEPHSPGSGSPAEAKEETLALKNELRRSAQKIADLEARVHGSADIRQLDSKLREKRSTVAFLDSQKEIMVRELEVLTEHVAEAKDNDRPLDLEGLTSKVVREFAMSLERLKDTYGPEVEGLIRRKHELTEENARLSRARDRAIEETEQLNLKNAQLADLNNELTHQIQERYKANRDQAAAMEAPAKQSAMANGLGIYTTTGGGGREKSDLYLDARDYRPGTGYGGSTSSSIQGMMTEPNDAESATVLASPHVVNIRKGQVKKFNWKKGGQQVAKGVSKGFKGAFSSAQQQQQQQQQQPGFRDGHGHAHQVLHQHQGAGQAAVEGMPYGGMVALESPGSGMNGGRAHPPPAAADSGRGFFGQRLGKGLPPKMPSNGNLLHVSAEGPATLFGSELIDRAEYERRQIPSVVTRCIEEVELRGMDTEGIYRKTGGNSQVKIIQEGFEKMDDYDISDPNLDITAVTSVLKQYLRRLPTPLLTFDVYDSILEANAVADDEKKALSMRAACQTLPARHRDCLEFLVFHLARVALREKENLMTPRNLAVVFAPTIMRDNNLEREMFDMHAKNAAIQFLIENNKMIFSGSSASQGPVL